MSADPEATARAQAMGERVVRTARAKGTDAAALPLLQRAHALAMETRFARGTDAHAPDFLHPGRSALILLLDLGESRPEVLAAAMLTESERPGLRPDPEGFGGALGAALGAEVARLVSEVPLPDADDLVERLVVAEEEVQRIALAERLDHLRHAHLWGEPDRARAAHALASDVYAPFALRVHETLARRYDKWCRMFAREHLS